MSKIKEHCGCDKGHPEIKPVPVVKTIRKIVKQARDKKKYKQATVYRRGKNEENSIYIWTL